MIEAMVIKAGGKYYEVVFCPLGRKCDRCVFKTDCGEIIGGLCTELNDIYGSEEGCHQHYFKEVVSRDTALPIGTTVECVDESCCGGMETGRADKIKSLSAKCNGVQSYNMECGFTQCENCLKVI